MEQDYFVFDVEEQIKKEEQENNRKWREWFKARGFTEEQNSFLYKCYYEGEEILTNLVVRLAVEICYGKVWNLELWFGEETFKWSKSGLLNGERNWGSAKTARIINQAMKDYLQVREEFLKEKDNERR